MSKLETKRKERQVIEEMFSDISNEVFSASKANDEIKNPDKSHILNYYTLKDVCDKEAKELIDNMVNFFLAEEIINVPYVKSRISDDISTISDLLFNMKTSEYAIIKLLEVIDEGGSYNSKNFEQLSKLQTSKMEIVKHYEALKTIIENNYKSLKRDYREIFMLEDDNSVEGFGHKGLLARLKDNFEDDEIEYAEEDTSVVTVPISNDDEETEEIVLPKGVKLYDANRD